PTLRFRSLSGSLVMSPEFCLHFAGIVLSYFLKVAAAYLACWLLNRLLRRPQQRFLMWMVLLQGAGTYWLTLIFRELRALPWLMAGSDGAAPGTSPAATHSFVVPLAWSHAILIAAQVLGWAYGLAAVLLMGVAMWRHLRLRLPLRQATEPSDALAGHSTSATCAVGRSSSQNSGSRMRGFQQAVAGDLSPGRTSNRQRDTPRSRQVSRMTFNMSQSAWPCGRQRWNGTQTGVRGGVE
ncbi:MAG TPA: hypothetical protein VIX19_07160, partial [Terriglobales bacterium]